jgi:hypothetical protein
MLKEVVDKDKLQKRIAVCTGSAAFSQVLQHLLASWGFDLCRQDDPSVLLLAEEGCCEPVAGQKSIWLSRSRETVPDRIRLPIAVESLWRVLEQRFHHQPRMHMRMAVDLPARLYLRGEWVDTRLNSLSDMGARFGTEREMVKQEPVSIELNIDGRLRQYHGEVIFSMAVGAADRGLFQSGVVFSGQDQTTCDGLRAVLISRYLEAVREKMDRQLFEAGLADLDLDTDVRRKLMHAD